MVLVHQLTSPREECRRTCPNAFPPELEAIYKILNIEEGSEALLRINVSGNPFPSVTWQREGHEVQLDDRIEILEDKTIRIASVQFVDAGTWTVAANNGLGQVVRKQISLTVYPSSIPITVTVEVEQLELDAGEEVVMPCQVEGYPVPTVAWLKNNARLPRSNRFVVSDQNTLTIKRASPIGEISLVHPGTDFSQTVGPISARARTRTARRGRL